VIICTKERPYNAERDKDERVQHPDAIEGEQEDGWPAGDLVNYYCPNCGLRFKVELPQ